MAWRWLFKSPLLSSKINLLFPLALQPSVDFGLSNNVLPFFPICHQHSPSSHSQHLKISFLLPLSIFSWVFPFFSSLPRLEWISFWASCPPPFSLGDLTSLSFALLPILLYFILCSSLLVLDSSDFSIPRVKLIILYVLTDLLLSISLSFATSPAGDRGSTVVKVLCYKSKGRWIFHWHKILSIALWPWVRLSL